MAAKTPEKSVFDSIVESGGELGKMFNDIANRYETMPSDPLVVPVGSERFEGSDFHTIMMGYDSMASWYITRNAMQFMSLPRWSDFCKLIDEMMWRMAYCRVRVANDIYAPYGMAFVCEDTSRILLVQAPEGTHAKHRHFDIEFVLIRLTGDVVQDGIYHVDFSYSPPVASLNEPKPMDPSRPTKNSMYLRDNYNKSPQSKGMWSPA